MRCAGYDRVDLDACEQRGISVTRVPAYSPHAIAEHAVALMLALNRQLVKASMRVIQGNYSLSGLVGFNMHGKTVGVIGTGKIGRCTIDILLGMGCRVLAHDLYPNEEMLSKGVEYLSLEELLPQSDIVTLHCPLNSTTQHLMNENRLSQMKHGAMLINTSRGALVETHALDKALERRQVGSVGMDVYENESGLFFTDSACNTCCPTRDTRVRHHRDLAAQSLTRAQRHTTDNMPGASLPPGAWDYALHSSRRARTSWSRPTGVPHARGAPEHCRHHRPQPQRDRLGRRVVHERGHHPLTPTYDVTCMAHCMSTN